MQEVKKINPIHTPCKDCIFATYNNHNTQIGCKANMLEKFKQAGYEILEVYDNEREFFVINNKKCIFIRNNTWLGKQNLDQADERALTIAIKENNIKYILLLNIDSNTNEDDIKILVDDFSSQDIPPVGILVMTNGGVNIQSIAKYLDSKKIKWRIQKFIDNTMDSSQKIKHIIQAAPINRYYYYINPSNYKLNTIDITFINNKILDGLVFGCLDVAGGLLFSYLSWQYAKNNQNIDILSDSQYHIPYEKITS